MLGNSPGTRSLRLGLRENSSGMERREVGQRHRPAAIQLSVRAGTDISARATQPLKLPDRGPVAVLWRLHRDRRPGNELDKRTLQHLSKVVR